MATRSVATVFGGSGFIGRYVVKRLAAAGYVVRVAVRDPEAALFLKPMGAVGQIVPLFAALPDRGTAARAVAGADLAVNLVGILAERRAGDFQRVHADGAGVGRLVHLSAIGADPASPSLYARSKAEGERVVRAAFPAATLLRPSVVFGPEDQFFNRIAALAQVAPFLPVIAGSDARSAFRLILVAFRLAKRSRLRRAADGDWRNALRASALHGGRALNPTLPRSQWAKMSGLSQPSRSSRARAGRNAKHAMASSNRPSRRSSPSRRCHSACR
jgi:uncharacterized protein YbjT (DUF2867 family)